MCSIKETGVVGFYLNYFCQGGFMTGKTWLEDSRNGLVVSFSRLLKLEEDPRTAMARFCRNLAESKKFEQLDVSMISISLKNIEISQQNGQILHLARFHLERSKIKVRFINVPSDWNSPGFVFRIEGHKKRKKRKKK
jgi:hypothetical protein